MPDYLHLTEKGYTIWAQAIEAKLAELMKNQDIPFRVVNSREQSHNLLPHSYLAATEREISTVSSIPDSAN